MTFLPIAERELIVAARRPATFRVRRTSALLGSVVAFMILVFGSSTSAGANIFGTLSIGVFAFALGAGVFLTADSISSERREGTLGLLFLTDLGGFDVVAGKFLAGGLNAFYGLLAVLPVMATAWFLGGVTGGEFWRMALVLLNTLLLSLSIGLAVSTRARSETEAYSFTALGLALITLVPAAIAWGLTQLGLLPALAAFIKAFSPLSGFVHSRDLAYRAGPGQFWWPFVTVHAIAWGILALGSHRLRRGWRDAEELQPVANPTPGRGKPRAATPTAIPSEPTDDLELRRGWREPGVAQPAVTSPEGAASIARRGDPSDPAPGDELRRRLRRDINPVMVLVETDPRVARLAWICAAIGAIGLGGVVLLAPKWSGAFNPYVATVLIHLAWLPLKLVFAWKACHFFASGRRDGTMELLLTTPATDFEIVRGQMLGLRHLFTRPVLVMGLSLAVAWGGGILSTLNEGFLGSMAGLFVVVAVGAYQWFTLLLDLHTLAWMGFWFALVEPKPGVAFTKTLVRAVIIPFILFCLPNLLVNGLQLNWTRDRFRMNLKSILQGARDPWPLR